MAQFQVGQVVKFLSWHGVVSGVYVSQELDKVKIEVIFVKNVFKGQQPEMINASDLEVADRSDLEREIRGRMVNLENNLHSLWATTASETPLRLD